MFQQREVAFNEIVAESDPLGEQRVCKMLQSWDTKINSTTSSYVMITVFHLLEPTLEHLFATSTGGVLGGKLPMSVFKQIAKDMMHGLAFLASIDVVHGDIKPVRARIDCVFWSDSRDGCLSG